MKFWDTTIDTFDFDKSRSELISNLDFIASMDVKEQTLYKKWIEFNEDLHKSYKRLPVLQSYYDKLWSPTDLTNYTQTIKEIQELSPYVEIIDTPDEASKWTDIRTLIHTMDFNANPGRNIKCYVKDRNTGKILGQIGLGSDITSLGVRDNFIGWTKEDKFAGGKLNNTTIATTLVSTQPFGYNMLGGKLVAALSTSPVIRDYWEKKYGNKLIAVGTTSLYGIHSIYNSIPHFKTLGESKGLISIKPDDKYYDVWHHWLQTERQDWYKEQIEVASADMNGPVSGVKQKILGQIFKELGIKQGSYNHGFRRGVYFASIYENGNDFLCSKIEVKDLKINNKFERGDDYTIDWWRKKAINRYTSLFNDNKIKPEVLYYSDTIGMTWDECKTKYLAEVGR
jgi:hypothetical protein